MIDVLSHGRSEELIGLNVARTIGRFSTVFPLFLDLRRVATLERLFTEVQSSIGRIPNQGLGFGLLTHLCDSETIRARLAGLPKAQICFNYAGRFDNALLPGSPFAQLGEVPRRGTLRMRGERRYLIELNCGVMDQRLQFEWRFSASTFDRATVEEWSRCFLDCLGKLASSIGATA